MLRLGCGHVYDKTASGPLLDNIYRLTNETISLDPHSNNGSVAYGLDPVGNRLSQQSTLSAIASISLLGYDPDDRLSTETYDNNGNTLISGASTFVYDFENHLKSMTAGSVSVALQYDGDGNRVAKTVGGRTTRYLVDDLNPTGYAQVVEELGVAGVQRTYTYGRQRISQNQLTSSEWTPSFYGYDGFGSVRTLTDASGTVTDTYDYDAWGNAVNVTGSTPNVCLYRGEQYDPDLRLYYLRARYFNPLSGRFLTKDPEAGRIKVPASLHRYLYAAGDPVNRSDPRGRSDMLESLGITAKDLKTFAAMLPALGVAIYSCNYLLADALKDAMKLASSGTATPEQAQDAIHKVGFETLGCWTALGALVTIPLLELE
jgi:RHS repeat-associated protein